MKHARFETNYRNNRIQTIYQHKIYSPRIIPLTTLPPPAPRITIKTSSLPAAHSSFQFLLLHKHKIQSLIVSFTSQAALKPSNQTFFPPTLSRHSTKPCYTFLIPQRPRRYNTQFSLPIYIPPVTQPHKALTHNTSSPRQAYQAPLPIPQSLPPVKPQATAHSYSSHPSPLPCQAVLHLRLISN